jgi:NDP-sugar pyrophosphorylase family protein
MYKEYGALGSATSLYKWRGNLASRYLVIYGDVLTNLNYGWFYENANRQLKNGSKGNNLVLLAHRSNKPEECGVLETVHESGILNRLI